MIHELVNSDALNNLQGKMFWVFVVVVGLGGFLRPSASDLKIEYSHK